MNDMFRHSFFNVLATLVSLVCGFLVTATVARNLGPEGAGHVALVIWLAMTVASITTVGGPQIILKYSSEVPVGSARALSSSLLFRALPGAVALAVTIPFAAVFPIPYFQDIQVQLALASSLFLLIYFLFVFSSASASGLGRFAETAFTTTVGSMLQFPAAAIGALFAGPAGAVLGMAVRYVPQTLLIRKYLRFPRREDKKVISGTMRRYGRHIWLVDMIDLFFLSRVELLILTLFGTTSAAGYFAVAVAFSGLVGQISLQLSAVFVVGFSDRKRVCDAGEEARLYASSLRILALVLFPVAFGGAVIMPQVIPLVFGPEFLPAVPSAAVMMVASAPAGLAIVPWGYLSAKAKGGALLRTMIAMTILSLPVLALAVAWFGLFGVSAARSALEMLFLVLLLWIVSRGNGPGFPWSAVSRTVAAAGLCAAAAYAVTCLLPGAPGLAAAIVTGALSYIVAIRGLRVVPNSDRVWLLAQLERRVTIGSRPVILQLCELLVGKAQQDGDV